jgi:hypothetical protein
MENTNVKLPPELRKACRSLNQATTLVALSIAKWPKNLPLSYRYYVARALSESQGALSSLECVENGLRTRDQNARARASAISRLNRKERRAQRGSSSSSPIGS